jgi:hypothetical protein
VKRLFLQLRTHFAARRRQARRAVCVVSAVAAALVAAGGATGCTSDLPANDANMQRVDGGERAMDGVEHEVLARPLDETHPSLAGLKRLRGDVLQAAVVGRTLAAVPRGGLPQSETFRPGGELGVQLDRVEVRGRYRVVGDALCTTVRTHPASCRALYRSEDGKFYQLFYGGPNVPAEVTVV